MPDFPVDLLFPPDPREGIAFFVARAAAIHYFRHHWREGSLTVYELGRKIQCPAYAWRAAESLDPLMVTFFPSQVNCLRESAVVQPRECAFLDDSGLWHRRKHYALGRRGAGPVVGAAMRILRRLAKRGPLRLATCDSNPEALLMLLEIGSVICFIDKPRGRRIAWLRLAEGARVPTPADADEAMRPIDIPAELLDRKRQFDEARRQMREAAIARLG